MSVRKGAVAIAIEKLEAKRDAISESIKILKEAHEGSVRKRNTKDKGTKAAHEV